jgi:hypothetical protein
MYLNDIDNDPRAWNFGTRLVKDFDCNSSRTYQFFNFSRKYEEFPNQPVFEHNGHYYKLFNEQFHSHSTATPTPPGLINRS